MTPTDVAPIATNARRQLNAERVGCILQADQVLDLCESYADAIDRLAQIAAIVERMWVPFCDHDRDEVRKALHEIERVCKIGEIGA